MFDPPSLRPGDPLDSRASDATALISVALAAAVVTPPLLFEIDLVAQRLGRGSFPPALLVLSTMAFTVLLGVFVLRGKRPGAARVRTIMGAVLLGIANGLFARALVALVRGHGATSALAADALPIGFGGALFGFLYGAALAPVLGAALRARLQPSFDGRDRVLATAGATIAAAGALTAPWSPPWTLDGPTSNLSYSALAAGIIAIGVAALRLHARAAFLARVRAGVLAPFRIAPFLPTDHEPGLVPLQRTDDECPSVLERQGGTTPYRAGAPPLRIALVGAPDRPSGLVSLVPAFLEEVGLVCATLLLGALFMFMTLFPLALFVGCVSGL